MTDEDKKGAYDKHGRPFVIGDVVKVFHFIGARRKRHYMYKQVVSRRDWPSGFSALFFSHLTMHRDDGFYVALDGEHHADYEIVQSVDAAFEDRPRAILQEQSNG